MKQLVDGDASMVIDDRHGALYISTVFGAPTERLMNDYFAWYRPMIETHMRLRKPWVHVTDALETGRPSPKVRALVADLTNTLPDLTGVNVGNYLVIGSALVRGAITAMQWLSRRRWDSEVVGSMDEALRRGLADLRAAGAPVPPIDPKSYRRPERPR
jgi:hypothetical protein